MDSDLNLLWYQCYGGSLNELICSISSNQGGYYINHSTDSNDGDLYGAGLHDGLDIWITKNDSLGNLIWGKCYGGSNNEFGTRTFLNDNGDLTVFGITESNDGDVQGIHSLNKDIWIFKIDSTGNQKWQQCIGGTGTESLDIGVKKISNDSYVVTAVTFGSFGSGDINCNTTADTGNDIWIFKVTDTTIVSRDENKFSKLRVFPNPSCDYIRFESDEMIKGFFTLYNLLGERVIDEETFENDSLISVEQMPSGIYLYTLTDKKGTFSAGKLIIN